MAMVTACGNATVGGTSSAPVASSPASEVASVPESSIPAPAPSEVPAVSEASEPTPLLENGILLEKRDGYHIAEVRYQTTDGTPIAMEVKYTNFMGDNQVFANFDAARDAGVLDVVEKDGAYVYTIKKGASINWVFTPVAATAPKGYDDTKKEIPVALSAEDADSGVYSVYTITCDYTPSLVQPAFSKVDK